MIFKGYEIIKDINILPIGTQIKSTCGAIYILTLKSDDKTRTFKRINKNQSRFCTYKMLSEEYEIIENKKKDISLLPHVLRDELFIDNEKIDNEQLMYILNEIIEKENKLIQIVNKIKQE